MKILRKISTAFLTLVLRNTDNSWNVTIPTTADYTVPDITVYSKDANGQTIATPYPSMKDYTEVGSIPDANGWIRPADWLPISHLVTDGEEKAVALYAVWDAAGIANGYNNYCALYVTGNYTVDWGDGTVENFASGVQAEHEYIYANLPASSYCSRGYRQAIITITPQAGQHLTLLNFSRKHTSNSVKYCTNNFLDVQISGTDLTRIMMYESTHSMCKMLERFYGYQITNKLTSMLNMFNTCYSLESVLISINTTSVTTMATMFYFCVSLKNITLNLTTTSLLNMANMFYYCSSLTYINILSFNTAIVTNMSFLFSDCTSLKSVNISSFVATNVTTIERMFSNCPSLITADLSTTILSSLTSNYNIFANSASLTICRIPGISNTFSVANNLLDETNLNLLFGDLKDLTLLPTQTITITGNPGAATCNPAIATAKNWIVVT